jgi:hypothetical protein
MLECWASITKPRHPIFGCYQALWRVASLEILYKSLRIQLKVTLSFIISIQHLQPLLTSSSFDFHSSPAPVAFQSFITTFNNFSISLITHTVKMQYSSSILLLAFAATNVFAHGVIDSVTGANGVTMPGLSGG